MPRTGKDWSDWRADLIARLLGPPAKHFTSGYRRKAQAELDGCKCGATYPNTACDINYENPFSVSESVAPSKKKTTGKSGP